jgi:hypothetical protein
VGYGEPILGLTRGRATMRQLGGGERRWIPDVLSGGALGGGRGGKGSGGGRCEVRHGQGCLL